MRLTVTVPYQTQLLLDRVKKQYPITAHLTNTLIAAALQRGLREFQRDPQSFAAEQEVTLLPVRLIPVPGNEVEPRE